MYNHPLITIPSGEGSGVGRLQTSTTLFQNDPKILICESCASLAELGQALRRLLQLSRWLAFLPGPQSLLDGFDQFYKLPAGGIKIFQFGPG